MPNEPEYFARPYLVNLRVGGRITSFAELPEAAQLALAHYMSIDGEDGIGGEAWDIPVVLADEMEEIWLDHQGDVERERLQKEALRDALPYYIAQYGNFQIGYHPCIPTADLIAAVMNHPELHEEFENWASYHDWYVKHSAMPKYDVGRELWPVILSSLWDDETLLDGWHRFHHYVRSGVKCIPALYYD